MGSFSFTLKYFQSANHLNRSGKYMYHSLQFKKKLLVLSHIVYVYFLRIAEQVHFLNSVNPFVFTEDMAAVL
jgi:hypothetical protein